MTSRTSAPAFLAETTIKKHKKSYLPDMSNNEAHSETPLLDSKLGTVQPVDKPRAIYKWNQNSEQPGKIVCKKHLPSTNNSWEIGALSVSDFFARQVEATFRHLFSAW